MDQTFQKIATGDYVVPIKDACIHDGEYAESYQLGYYIFDYAMKVPNEKLGGVRNGDLVIITGKSGEGKTTFMQNIALKMNNNALPCLFILVWYVFFGFMISASCMVSIVFTCRTITLFLFGFVAQ